MLGRSAVEAVFGNVGVIVRHFGAPKGKTVEYGFSGIFGRAVQPWAGTLMSAFGVS